MLVKYTYINDPQYWLIYHRIIKKYMIYENLISYSNNWGSLENVQSGRYQSIEHCDKIWSQYYYIYIFSEEEEDLLKLELL